MSKKTVEIPVEELKKLRKAAVAHDDYLEALKGLRMRSYSALLDPETDLMYKRGYNAALIDLSEAIVDALMARDVEDAS